MKTELSAMICTKSGEGFERGVIYPVVEWGEGVYIKRDLEEESTFNLFASEKPTVYDENHTIWCSDEFDCEFEDVDIKELYQHDLKDSLSQIERLSEIGETSVRDLIRAGNVSSMFGAIRSIARKAISSEHAEVLPEKVVKPDDTLDEGRRGVGVHDVGDGEVEKGRKIGSVFESLCRIEESVAEKFDVAKRIRVSEGVVVGDGTGHTCSVSDGGVSLFGFRASYFTKFKTPGWRPRTKLDYAMTSVFAQAMLGSDEGMKWFNLNRIFAWKGL